MRGVASAVAVEALPDTLPVSAPAKAVEVTDVSPESVVDDAPRAIAVVPTVTLELVNPEFGIVATLEITPPEVVVTYPAVVSGSVTVPVNVGEAFVASPDTDPPSETAFPLIVILEFVRLVLPIFDKVFVEPEIDLLVNVSVVALPTNVSVDVGRVNVPVLVI